MNDRILFIDTETGGMVPDKHSLLSIALVVWENKEIISSTELLINDGRLCVTQEALDINGINIETHKKTAISPQQAIDKILFFVEKHFPGKNKVTLAGHNVQFDVSFLKFMFSQQNKDFSSYFSHRVIDTSSILYYLYLSGKIDQKAVSSDMAFDLFNIKVKGRHTALGDAIATAQLFNKLLVIS